MKIIGITGPSGAGKSTALNYLGSKGYNIIDADQVYHKLLETDFDLLTEIEMRFPSAFEEPHIINRQELGRLVYSNAAAKADLEGLTHPAVLRRLHEQLDELRDRGAAVAVIEAIALIEGGVNTLCDAVVVVLARSDIRVSRITARDDVSIHYAASRMSAQRGEDFYRANADFVIENNSGKRELFGKIDKIISEVKL